MGCEAELVRLKGLAAKIEVDCGVDSLPTAVADAIQVEDNFWNSLTVDYFEENLRDNIAQSGLGRSGLSQPAGRIGEVEVSVVCKGVDGLPALTNRPEWDALLRACGVAVTEDATATEEKLIYSPTSSDMDTATIYAWSGGLLHKLVGCSGSATLTAIGGQLLVWTFSMQGILNEIEEVALPAFTYPQRTVRPPVVQSSGLRFQVGADPVWTPDDFQSFEFSTGTVIVGRPRGNAEFGNAGYVVTDWDPQVTVNLDRPPLAAFHPWDVRHLGLVFDWGIGPIGGIAQPAGNRITLQGETGRIIDVSPQDSDGIAMVEMQYRAQNADENTPDSAWELIVGTIA